MTTYTLRIYFPINAALFLLILLFGVASLWWLNGAVASAASVHRLSKETDGLLREVLALNAERIQFSLSVLRERAAAQGLAVVREFHTVTRSEEAPLVASAGTGIRE